MTSARSRRDDMGDARVLPPRPPVGDRFEVRTWPPLGDDLVGDAAVIEEIVPFGDHEGGVDDGIVDDHRCHCGQS